MSLRSNAKFVIVAASLALVVGTLGGCHKSSTSSSSTKTGGGNTGSLPAAATLLSQAQTAMSSVQSVHFTVTVDGTLANLPVKSATGTLLRSGSAQGTATVVEFGATIQVSFVIVGDTFYFKGLTGGYSKLPLASASQFYDPSAILDPNRGISKLIASSTNAKTVGSTTINGSTAYQVSLTPDPTALQSLIPGAGAGTTGSIWIDKTTSRVVKGVFVVPNSGGKSATVTITLDNYNAPATINAPSA